MNKTIKKIIFLFCILLVNPIVIIAAKDTNNAGASIGGCNQNYSFCWLDESNYAYLAPGIQGMRVTVYNSKGEKVSDTKDFTNNYNAVDVIKNRTYYMGSGKSRIDYINSNGEFTRKEAKPQISYLGFDNFIHENYHAESIISFGDNVESTIEVETNYCKEDYAKYCNVNYAYYYVIEPLTIIFSRRDKDKYDYYGTYYELVEMIGKEVPFTTSGQGVNFFLPGNMAISLYIKGGSVFDEFYKKIGLSPVNGENLNTIKGILNLSKKSVTDWGNGSNAKTISDITTGVNSGYGVGVIESHLEPDEKEEPKPTKGLELDCKTNSSVNTCGNPNSEGYTNNVMYEYTSCSLKDPQYADVVAGSGENCNGEFKEVTLASIRCDEKYFIDIFNFHNSFQPIGENVLAGTYFGINGPTVYHKKVCQFIEADYETIENTANVRAYQTEYATCYRTPPTLGESPVPYSCPRCSFNYELKESYIKNYKEQIKILKQNYEQMVNNLEKDAHNDQLGDISLKMLNSYNYNLKATRQYTELNVDGYKYGYKNTFVYSLADDVNRYISIKDAKQDFNKKATKTNYDNKVALATTPINLKSGTYSYIADYSNITSESFRAIYGSITTMDECKFDVDNRNIKKFCDATKEECGNPNTTFNYPDILYVYRPIDLNVPFPGHDYNGIKARSSGTNWDETLINTYITNNRGVVTTEIYNKNALYIIDLDASKIKAIREYNKENHYDDFTLECTLGYGNACVSKFLREQNILNGGTCADIALPDDTGIANENFYSCWYSK